MVSQALYTIHSGKSDIEAFVLNAAGGNCPRSLLDWSVGLAVTAPTVSDMVTAWGQNANVIITDDVGPLGSRGGLRGGDHRPERSEGAGRAERATTLTVTGRLGCAVHAAADSRSAAAITFDASERDEHAVALQLVEEVRIGDLAALGARPRRALTSPGPASYGRRRP
jgi:hypothetical protein